MALPASEAIPSMVVAQCCLVSKIAPFCISACTSGLSASDFGKGTRDDPASEATFIVRLANAGQNRRQLVWE